jgi:D-cysteine desulfhydrase family pyridoxal phosphate-dependent enzyme
MRGRRRWWREGTDSAVPARPWDSLPRLRLAALPTPLERLPRFSEAIGSEVWMKRDDVGSLGLAGNKVRKLEFTLAEAQQQGADTILIIGAEQSNAARATAAACARLGLECVLVLSGDEPPSPTGNLVLDHLFGADVRFAGDVGWAELWQASEEIAAELKRDGAHPYSLPAGSSSPLGAVGFTQAWFELLDQLETEPTALYFASSSGGTHAGLLLGRALAPGPPLRSIGVAPDIVPNMPGYITSLATQAAGLINFNATIETAEIDMSHLGDGYAIPTDEANAAIRLLAETEAILCDPIYSGKALAALVADKPDGPVVFWHTGGHHALFAPRFGDAVVAGRQRRSQPPSS